MFVCVSVCYNYHSSSSIVHFGELTKCISYRPRFAWHNVFIVLCSDAGELTTKDAIKEHRASVLSSDACDAYRITVRRGNIMDDTIFALRPGFDEKKHIRVRFLGEHAIVQPVGRFYVDII